VSACEVVRRLREVLVSRSPGACVFQDLHERIILPADVHVKKVSVEKFRQVAENALVARTATCATHGGPCESPDAILNVSGSSCRPWSRSNRGAQRGWQHEDMKALRAWIKTLKKDKPKIVVHENVHGFHKDVLIDPLAELCDFVCELKVKPSDAGFGFIRRPRVYHVLVLRESGISLARLPGLYRRLADALDTDVSVWHEWVWRASPDELETEIAAVQVLRKSPSRDWRQLLTMDQQSSLAGFEMRWRERAGRDARQRPECLFDLGDTPKYKSGLPQTNALPTARRRESPWWSPSRGRWMLPREKAACMGFPVYDDLARRALVPVDSLTAGCPASAVGNAMHVANVGLVILSTMVAAEWPRCP
jgi:site-specific DNA-cytosine methylase